MEVKNSDLRLNMRRRKVATFISLLATTLIALIYQNCAGGMSASSGNGGSYGGGGGRFMAVECVTDQNSSAGSPITVSIQQSTDVTSYSLAASDFIYVAPTYTLKVDISQYVGSYLIGEMDYNDNGTMTNFTVKCTDQ